MPTGTDWFASSVYKILQSVVLHASVTAFRVTSHEYQGAAVALESNVHAKFFKMRLRDVPEQLSQSADQTTESEPVFARHCPSMDGLIQLKK